jgi:hypothetical protein
MKTNTTYADIYARQMEIARFAQEYPTMAHFMRANIGRFEADNKPAITAIITAQRAIYEAHVCKDEAGNYEMEDEIGKEPRLKFKSALDEQAWRSKWDSLMATPCILKL